MINAEDLWSPFALRVRCGPLEMRAVTDADLPALVQLALEGIHPPEQMPFATPWTDAPPSEIPAGTAAYYWSQRAAFDHLDAEEITSAAFVDNPASEAVSRKVGYVDNGTSREQRRPGELAVQRGFLLTRERLNRPEHPVEVEGVEPLRRAVGLPT